MPNPRAVYSSIAASLRTSSAAVSWQGVQQLDRVIQETLRERPKLRYEDALADITLDGRPLNGTLLNAARQLQEARRTRLLRPGDEDT